MNFFNISHNSFNNIKRNNRRNNLPRYMTVIKKKKNRTPYFTQLSQIITKSLERNIERIRIHQQLPFSQRKLITS